MVINIKELFTIGDLEATSMDLELATDLEFNNIVHSEENIPFQEQYDLDFNYNGKPYIGIPSLFIRLRTVLNTKNKSKWYYSGIINYDK